MHNTIYKWMHNGLYLLILCAYGCLIEYPSDVHCVHGCLTKSLSNMQLCTPMYITIESLINVTLLPALWQASILYSLFAGCVIIGSCSTLMRSRVV